MSSHMINLFLCILSSLYLCFGLLYFCCRILPSKHKISLPLFLCLSVFMALLFWIKRESQHNGITIVFQLTTFLVTLFLFQASFMKKLAVYFIFQLLIICPEILCTSVFIALHNLFIPTDTYTPHNLISSCSPAEYFVIELSNILLGLFLLWKISEILRQCIDYLKILTFLQLLLPLIAPVFLNVIISLQKKPEAVLALSIIYWIICIGFSFCNEIFCVFPDCIQSFFMNVINIFLLKMKSASKPGIAKSLKQLFIPFFFCQ